MPFPDRYLAASQTPGGVAFILADLRARALAGGQAGVANPRAAIGSNIAQQDVAVLADLFKAGANWQDENAGYDYSGPPVDAPAGSRRYLNLPPPYADGEWHVARWKEPGNASGVSTWTRTYTNFFLEYTGTRFTDVTESYKNGIFTSRFRYYARTATGNPAGLIRWAGSGTVELLDFRPEDLPASQAFNPQIITISSQRRGNARWLDLGGGNFWRQNWMWDQRARVNHEANKGSTQPSIPLEQVRDFSIQTNRDVEWIMTHRMREDTVKKMMRAFFTGEGFDDGIALPSHLKMYVELGSNESWNFQLTGAAQDLAGLGVDMGYVGDSVNYARLYAQEKIARQMSTWIKQAIPEYMDRVVLIIGLSPDNDMNDWISMTINGSEYFDAVSKSCYPGIGAKANFGNNTPAEIAAAWGLDADKWADAFLANREVYYAAGKRVLCYEIGSDTAYVPWTAEQRATWLESPEFAVIYKRILSRMLTVGQDRINLYWDFGPYRTDAPASAWGHYQGAGKNNQKWTIANEVQAEVDAAAN